MYNTLSKLTDFRSVKATLWRDGGEKLEIVVKPEAAQAEEITPEHPAAIEVRTWSASAEQFLEKYPRQGDLLVLRDDEGVERKYKLIRDAVSSRMWNWKYAAPGVRLLFYTKTTNE